MGNDRNPCVADSLTLFCRNVTNQVYCSNLILMTYLLDSFIHHHIQRAMQFGNGKAYAVKNWKAYAVGRGNGHLFGKREAHAAGKC
jgi:hypothetical protein